MMTCPCGGVLDPVGPVGFCRDCRSMTDLATLVVYQARPIPILAPGPVAVEIDIAALAEAFMDAQRRFARRFGIHAFTSDTLPPAYEDLGDNQREHLHASLEAALRAVAIRT